MKRGEKFNIQSSLGSSTRRLPWWKLHCFTTQQCVWTLSEVVVSYQTQIQSYEWCVLTVWATVSQSSTFLQSKAFARTLDSPTSQVSDEQALDSKSLYCLLVLNTGIYFRLWATPYSTCTFCRNGKAVLQRQEPRRQKEESSEDRKVPIELPRQQQFHYWNTYSM